MKIIVALFVVAVVAGQAQAQAQPPIDPLGIFRMASMPLRMASNAATALGTGLSGVAEFVDQNSANLPQMPQGLARLFGQGQGLIPNFAQFVNPGMGTDMAKNMMDLARNSASDVNSGVGRAASGTLGAMRDLGLQGFRGAGGPNTGGNYYPQMPVPPTAT